MATERFSNVAVTTVAQPGGILISATAFYVTSSALFPSLPQFRILVEDEIMIVTGVAGNMFTVLRAQEGSSIAEHAYGVTVAHVLTAGGLMNLNHLNISEYADNAAAILAGLVAGDIYHTAGTVKIVV